MGNPRMPIRSRRVLPVLSLLPTALLVVSGTVRVGAARARAEEPPRAEGLRFEVTLPAGVDTVPLNGRLLVILGPEGSSDPRRGLGRIGPQAAPALARDIVQLAPAQA